MKFVRRAMAILIFTVVLLLIAMFILDTMRHGGRFDLDSLLQWGKRGLSELPQDLKDLPNEFRRQFDNAVNTVKQFKGAQ